MPSPGVPKTYDALIAESSLPRAEARLLMASALQAVKSAAITAITDVAPNAANAANAVGSTTPPIPSALKTWLIAHGDQLAPEPVEAAAQSLFARRVSGEPIAYLLGEKEFYGRSFTLGPGILIPRPETELLVEWALEVLHVKAMTSHPVINPTLNTPTLNTPTTSRSAEPGPHPLRVLDMGCGSGCLGITLALEAMLAELPLASITLTDIADEPLEFARSNARQLGLLDQKQVSIYFSQGDWYAALTPGRHFDLMVSNPPYIAEADAHLWQGDLRFEPHHALASGADGLAAMRSIIAGAAAWLHPSGTLLLEHGYQQADIVRSLFSQAGFTEVESRKDLAGQMRATGGRLG